MLIMTKLFFKNSSSTLPVQSDNRKCPQCDSTYLDRIKRRVIDRIIGIIIPRKRYHCESCGWKGNLR